MFKNPHLPLTSSNWRWLTAIAATSLLTGAGLFLSTGQALASGPQCTSPYVQVQDGAAPTVNDPTGELTIQSVSVGEPFVNCSAKRITFVLKVNTMDPGNTGSVHALPSNAWQVLFLIPGSKNSSGADRIMYVQFETCANPVVCGTTGAFSYGFTDPSSGAGASYGGAGPVTGTVAPDGTFTMNVNIGNTITFSMVTGGPPAWSIDPSAWQGLTLTQIQGKTLIIIGGILLFQPVDDALTAGDGVYALQGNLSCSTPPVAALAAVPTFGNAPLTVNFDASASNIPAGGCGTINSYIFTFGDGVQITQSTPTISHTYTTGGVTYQARVRVTSTSGLTSSNIAQQNIQVNTAGPPILVSVGSRATHGIAGDFDVNLNLPPNNSSTNPRGVECRSLGGNYKIVFTFLNNLVTPAPTPTVTTGTFGTVSGTMGPNSNQFTVNVTGVTNQQYVGITLVNAKDTTGALGTEPEVQVGALIGDVNADGGLSNLDVSFVKAKVAAGAAVDSSNFRDDVNADGGFSNLDVSITKAQVAAGAALPSLP